MDSRHLVVGLDVGKNSAIACLDLRGNTVLLMHGTSMGFDGMVEVIRNAGVPSVIAGDKKHTNALVRRINAAFNSRLFEPQADITLEEKRNAVKGTGIKNEHERDAYAAAFKAYNYYVSKLRHVERVASKRSFHEMEADMVMSKVISRYSVSEALEGRKANRR
ncbi:MAG: DUF460 domain-containing protein [Candidatus Marsarchaeota archaeon]|nr:DUF460 domain-containing protein [Candidatus Marsarchaeota archaeon]